MRNKDLISKHVFAGNTRLVSKVVMNEEKSGKMVATEQGSYYYHADHLGSSSVVTDVNGKFYEQIEYFPYGETWVHNKASSTQTSTPYKFTSKEQDEETGLYYYGARYYDARLSRWISADDRFDDMFSTKGLDVFSYAHNNPIRYNDPTGHFIAEYADWMRGFASDSDKGTQGNGSNSGGDKESNSDVGKGSSGNAKPTNNEKGSNKTLDTLDEERIKQTNKDMKPAGDTACRYRVFQAGIERFLRINMLVGMINDATNSLTSGNDPAVKPGGKYNVKKPIEIMEDALQRLGKDPSKFNIIFLKPGQKGYETASGKATFSLRGMEDKNDPGEIGHWQLGDGSGNFVWDPWNGPSHNKNRRLIETQYVIITRKEE